MKKTEIREFIPIGWETTTNQKGVELAIIPKDKLVKMISFIEIGRASCRERV